MTDRRLMAYIVENYLLAKATKLMTNGGLEFITNVVEILPLKKPYHHADESQSVVIVEQFGDSPYTVDQWKKELNLR